MKKFVTALVVAGGVSLAFVPAATAVPVSNPNLASALNVRSLVQPAQYYGGYGGYGYRGYYQPACYYVRRCSGYYPYQHCWRERICH